MPYQMIAPGNQHFPVLARIGVRDLSDLRWIHRPPGGVQKGIVEPPFGDTSIRWRHQLRPSQVNLQEFVRDQQLPCWIAIKQMMAATQPKIMLVSHWLVPSRRVASSRCSSRSGSALTSSTKSKAREG